MDRAVKNRFRPSARQGNPPGCSFSQRRIHYRLAFRLDVKKPRSFSRRRLLPMLVIWMLSAFLICPLAAAAASAADSGSLHGHGLYVHRVFIGVLAHDVGGLWSGTRKEGGMDFNGEIVFCRPGISVFGGTLHPNLGISVNSQGATSKLYGGVVWEIKMQHGLFFTAGLGAAVHNGRRDSDSADEKSLGSRVLFRIPIEVGYQVADRHSLSILFDHVSNADLATPNEGLDTIGIRYGYAF